MARKPNFDFERQDRDRLVARALEDEVARKTERDARYAARQARKG